MKSEEEILNFFQIFRDLFLLFTPREGVNYFILFFVGGVIFLALCVHVLQTR
jgi:hypothetical protein